jgi:hypothetical protein
LVCRIGDRQRIASHRLVSGEPVGQSWSEPVAVPDAKAILVVEDDFLVRLYISDELIASGFHVIQAARRRRGLTGAAGRHCR